MPTKSSTLVTLCEQRIYLYVFGIQICIFAKQLDYITLFNYSLTVIFIYQDIDLNRSLIKTSNLFDEQYPIRFDYQNILFKFRWTSTNRLFKSDIPCNYKSGSIAGEKWHGPIFTCVNKTVLQKSRHRERIYREHPHAQVYFT